MQNHVPAILGVSSLSSISSLSEAPSSASFQRKGGRQIGSRGASNDGGSARCRRGAAVLQLAPLRSVYSIAEQRRPHGI
eukprot:3128316-Prymnesium_polylepis.1